MFVCIIDTNDSQWVSKTCDSIKIWSCYLVSTCCVLNRSSQRRSQKFTNGKIQEGRRGFLNFLRKNERKEVKKRVKWNWKGLQKFSNNKKRNNISLQQNQNPKNAHFYSQILKSKLTIFPLTKFFPLWLYYAIKNIFFLFNSWESLFSFRSLLS